MRNYLNDLDGGTRVIKIHSQQGIIGLPFLLFGDNTVIELAVPVLGDFVQLL